MPFGATDCDNNRFQKYNMRARPSKNVKRKKRVDRLREVFRCVCCVDNKITRIHTVRHSPFGNWPPIKNSILDVPRAVMFHSKKLTTVIWRQATAGDTYSMIYCCRLSATLCAVAMTMKFSVVHTLLATIHTSILKFE